MKPKSIFDRFITPKEEGTPKKKPINDLLTGKKDDFNEASKTFDTLKEFGFSTKTSKLIKNFNLKLRQDLNLNDLEYLIFVIALNAGNVSLNVLSSIIRENSINGLMQSLQIMFSLYHRGIFNIYPGDSEVAFRLSSTMIDYLYSRGEFKPEDKNLKRVIFDIDSIANLYNTPLPAIRNLGEANILMIINKYAEKHEYCALLKQEYEKSIQRGSPDYKFLFYMIGHLILNSLEFPSIDRNHALIDSFVNSDSTHESIINNVFSPTEKHQFLKSKIFDQAIDESGKADKNFIELHSEFKRKYVKGLIREKSHEDLIRSINIPKKTLFFNPSNQERINELTDMLSPKTFSNIKKRLVKAGTRTGFIILFSGFPGTGKTELSLQLAKKTGRDIIKVDMSTIRSKWWGEDERNVKNIFNNYNAILQDSKIEPILLLNEADAIIGKRLDVSGNNGAIISSINATQNIILDAFDNFEGILIATTNLTTNFDNAFERRFLYKIEFEKPNLEVRAQILVSMLKIPEQDAKIIAKDHELSGANIENIYRKLTTRKILYGDEYNLEKLLDLCKDEKIEKTFRIGFQN